jgi:hypothetical protein
MAVIWYTTLPAEFQEDYQEVSEGEYMAASNNRKDSPLTPIMENGIATGDKTATESSNDGEATGMTTRFAPSKSRERNAVDETATDNTAPKKAKKGPAKVEDAKSTKVPPPKKTKKRSIEVEDAEPGGAPAPKRRKACNGGRKAESIDMPPLPLPPAEVSKPVANKIVQVHNFINTHPDLKLDRDPNSDENEDHITIPELDINCILSTMYWHYELGTQPDTPLSDVENAIVNRCQQKLGTDNVLANVVTIDCSKLTKFEERIHEKIVRHGLDDKNLLKMEIEVFNERVSERMGLWRPAVENLLDAVADETGGENEIGGEAEAEELEESEATSAPQMIKEGTRRSSVCQLPLME